MAAAGPRGGRPRGRAELVDAATAVLVANPGAAMQHIAQDIGVGRATLHRHFPTRADLLAAIVETALADATARLEQARLQEGSAPEAISRVIEALVPMGHRFAFLLREPALAGWEMQPTGLGDEVAALVARFNGELGAVIERGRQEGSLRLDLPVVWVEDLLWSLVYTAWEGVQAGRLAEHGAAQLVATTVLEGLARRG